MAVNYLPSSTKYTLSPYESHSTNIVNRLSHIHTYAKDCILGNKNSLDVSIISGTSVLKINPGKCIIDDVLIETSDIINVNLLDINNFELGQTILSEVGYYYVCFYYKWLLTRTTPKAYPYIIHPSQTPIFTYNNNFLLLKILKVENVGGTNIPTAVYDYNPTNIDVYRRYKENYSEFFSALPTFNSNDTGRIIVVSTGSEPFSLYVGGLTKWELIATSGGSSTNHAQVVTNNYNPSASDDEFDLGTLWINTNLNSTYICTDNSPGAAVWHLWITSIGSYAPLVTSTSNPTTGDNTHNVGTLWINTNLNISFICVDITSNLATWNRIPAEYVFNFNQEVLPNLKRFFII